MAAALVLASCGGDDDSAAADRESQPTATTAQQSSDTTAPSSTAAASGEPALICDDPPPAAIALGSTTTDEIAIATNPSDYARCFSVEVPAGASELTFELAGLTDDLAMLVGYDDVETVQFNIGDFWRASESGTADEVIVIEQPQAGTYYITVSSGTFRNESPFTLTVATS